MAAIASRPEAKKLPLIKVKIKQWEVEFSKTHGRKPTKDDISSAAPAAIKENYKEYWTIIKNQAPFKHNLPDKKNEVWGTNLNKTELVRTSNVRGISSGDVVQSCVNKLREKFLMSKKPHPKLPSRLHVNGAILKNPDGGTTEILPVPVPECNESVESLPNKWKIPAQCLHVRDKTLQNRGKIRAANTFTSSNGSVYELSSAKVDLNWLKRCSDSYSSQPETESFDSEVNVPNSFSIVNREGKVAILESKNDCNLSDTGASFLNSNDSNIENAKDKEMKGSVESSKTKDKEMIIESNDVPPRSYEFVDDEIPTLTKETNSQNGKRKGDDDLEPKLKRQCIDAKSPVRNCGKKTIAKPHENFVKLNFKKKVFVRGKRNFSYKKFKRDKWKNYQKNKQLNNKLNDDLGEENNPTQKKSQRNAKEIWDGVSAAPTLDEILDDDLQTLADAGKSTLEPKPQKYDDCNVGLLDSKPVERLYDLDSSGNIKATPRHVLSSLKKMGFESFRPGQEKAVMRILSGLSALVVLPTGSGKSLCYQLPAFLYSQQYRCITLVISPLVSLMEDQVANVPNCLNAACWHSNLTEVQKNETLDRLASGKVDILLVSPEMLVGGSGYLFGKLPPVAFVCIDEAHCLSEWSHNFRPSYLQLVKVLKARMGISRILALTATASKVTTESIASHLSLTGDEEAVIEITGIPDNLLLSVSRDEFRDEALVNMLRGERFANCRSIIIYCTRREETERVASTIRICMQQEDVKMVSNGKNKKEKWLVEAYHSGLTPAKRKLVQKRFTNGALRIVVATVAFGMGLNKIDVRGIIHYNVPKTFEHYVQEIGRAGRDGLPAHCHLYLHIDGNDLPELRRHIYGNSVDRHVIRKLLLEVFRPCRCTESEQRSCPGHEIAIPIGGIVNELDLKEENVGTLLCYLELHPMKLVELLPPVYATCSIRCYRGEKQFQELTKTCPPVAVAVGLARKENQKLQNELRFHLVRVASHMDWDSGVVKKRLKSLEWTHIDGKWKKTGVMVEYSDLAFHVKVKGTLSDDQKDQILDHLYDKVSSTERRELRRLEEVVETFKKVAHSKYVSCCDEVDLEKSQSLKNDLMAYFARPVVENTEVENDNLSLTVDSAEIAHARKDIRAMLEIHHDAAFTGRAIARIFHGIESPCYPVEVWGRVRRFWRSHILVDFNLLRLAANDEIRKMR